MSLYLFDITVLVKLNGEKKLSRFKKKLLSKIVLFRIFPLVHLDSFVVGREKIAREFMGVRGV